MLGTWELPVPIVVSVFLEAGVCYCLCVPTEAMRHPPCVHCSDACGPAWLLYRRVHCVDSENSAALNPHFGIHVRLRYFVRVPCHQVSAD